MLSMISTGLYSMYHKNLTYEGIKAKLLWGTEKLERSISSRRLDFAVSRTEVSIFSGMQKSLQRKFDGG